MNLQGTSSMRSQNFSSGSAAGYLHRSGVQLLEDNSSFGMNNISKGFGQVGKRPLFEELNGGASVSLADLGGSPPKRVTSAFVKERPFFASYHPFQPTMVVQDSAENTQDSSASSSPATVETLPIPNGTNGVYQNCHNGHSRKADMDADYLVALYGCSGYGELAIKLNSTLPPATLDDVANGNVGIVDNQALWLWDEDAETVLLAWAVVDVKLNKVLAIEQRLVLPWYHENDNKEVLHESFRLESGIEEDQIKSSPTSLDAVLHEIQASIRDRTTGKVALVTVGPELLRQQLLPECHRHQINLPSYFFFYFDILAEMEYDCIAPNMRVIPKLLANMLENNQLVPETHSEYGKQHVAEMVKLIQFMIQNGHEFHLEKISHKYEPGLCTTDSAPDDCIVKARGLPWQASDLDVSRFFYGLDIPRGGIALCLSSHGRRNGEAIVLFSNSRNRDLALQRHRHHMQNRYIEVYRALSEDFQQVAGVCNTEVERFLKRDAGVIIRMRGLPYDATAKQVIDFFASGDKVVQVVDGEEGVMFVKKSDGRATGDAFVLFKDEADGQIATSKHRESIGTRYIELFRSTTAEVQQVLSKSQDRNDSHTPLISSPPMMPAINSPMSPNLLLQSPLLIGNGNTKRSCVRLRGLPFESSVDDILDFLGDHAKHIIVHGVHMVYNAQGQPSGEAFIQMDSDAAACRTAQERHNRYMNMTKYNKKNRYIEVYQCSPDEMNGNGLGGMPSLPSVRPLLPHGYGGLATYNPNFASPILPVSLPLILPQLAAGLRSPLPGMFSMQYWPYPSPPISPNNAFPSSVMSGFLPSLNGLSFVHLRNLPYQATTSDIATFLQGFVTQEAIQINRHGDGRPNGEAFVIFNNRDEAERIVHERNRQTLGNRHVEMSILV